MPWLILLIALNSVDALQTSYAVGRGFAREMNPVMDYCIRTFGMETAMIAKLWFIAIFATWLLARGHSTVIKILCIPYAIVCLTGAIIIIAHHGAT